MPFILTRIQVGDYDAWKPMFDQDRPGARTESRGWRILRNAEDPNEVFIQIEFETAEQARVGRERLLASGVLDRFDDKSGPYLAEVAETIER